MCGNDRLRLELTERGLKPSDLAKRLGMDRKTVRDVLRGAQDVRLRDVAHIAKALGFKVDLILDTITDAKETKRPWRARVKWI